MEHFKIDSLEWHKQNLKNSREFEANLCLEISRLQERLKRAQNYSDIREKQIARAEREGKPSFNADRFKV